MLLQYVELHAQNHIIPLFFHECITESDDSSIKLFYQQSTVNKANANDLPVFL